MKRVVGCAVVGLMGGMFASPAAMAQDAGEPELVNARPVWENARGGAVQARRPGRVVQMGVQRFRIMHDDALARAQSGPEITEVAPPVDRGSALRAQLLTGLFQNLDVTLMVIRTAILAGLGMDPGSPGDSDQDLSDLLGTITQ